SPETDAKIPVGTIIPGVIIVGDYTGDRGDVICAAHWQDGHWTVIASRDLKTGSKYDQDFIPGRDLYMWVAVFDHTQTRHTRHPRPVRILTEE
ncbi:MAG TPA: ethylbenzene dehydrogenase-related protein, partial [Xanthobacteraceae bacterium]|nr:ethylbenzene dehydrogenase-related protein [Xanthobacteraceae bacterium]